MRRRSRWNGGTRWTAALGVLCTVLAVAISLLAWRLPVLVEERISAELTSMGLPQAHFTLASVGWRRSTLSDLQLAPDLSADAIDVEYGDPLSLARGQLGAITIRGARWTTSLEELRHGTLSRLLDARASGTGSPPARVRLVDARLVTPELVLVIDGDLAPASGGYALSARTSDGGATVEVSGDATQAQWTVAGVVPTALLAPLPALAIEGELRADGRGSARRADGWSLDGSIDLSAHGLRVASLGLSARDLHAHLVGSATIDGDEQLHVDLRGRSEIGHAEVPGTRVEGVALSAALHLESDGETLSAWTEAPLSLRARLLATGPTRDREVRFANVVLRGTGNAARPALEIARHSARAALGFRGSASVGGLLFAREASLVGRIEVSAGPRGVRVAMPTSIAAPSVRLRDEDVMLSDALVALPMIWDEHGVFGAAGEARAGALTWNGLDLGAIRGALDLAPDAVTIDWHGRATQTAPFELRAAVGRETTLDVDVPTSDVERGDAFDRTLVAVAGLDVRGRAGGTIHVAFGTTGLGAATLTLDGASVEDTAGRGSARGARGTIVLGSLAPIESSSADRVTFTELRLGRMMRTRDGSARVRFEPSGRVRIDDAQITMAGGHVYAEPFELAPRAPDFSLALRFDGIRMDRVAALLGDERLRASGVLDGHLSLSVHLGETPAVALGDGILVARGPGRLHIASLPHAVTVSLDLDRIANGSWIEQRIAAALADFEYSELTFDVDRIGDEPCLHASITGHGLDTPQELDLTIAVEDVQALVDQSLRFWNASEPTRDHT